MRPRIDAVAQNHVDAKIFHRRVEVLFDGFGNSMDLVNEQDLARTKVG